MYYKFDEIIELLKGKVKDEFKLLNEYIDFSAEKIRDLLIAFKFQLGKDKWLIDRNNKDAVLNVTTINGILNTLRLIVMNGKINDIESYKLSLTDIDKFDFKSYKSSQYRKMGQEIYNKYFKD